MEDIIDKLKYHTDGRVAVFIDAANILYSQKSMGWEVDYKKLSRFFRSEFDMVDIYFYIGMLNEHAGQQEFLAILEDIKFIVRTKPIKYIKSGDHQVLKGNLDIELAYDILMNCDSFDTCFLFSGDSDFEIIVNHLRSIDKVCIAFSTRNHISRELIQASNFYCDMNRFRDFWSR